MSTGYTIVGTAPEGAARGKMYLDAGEIYDRAKEVAHVSVAGAPGTDYGLEDVMPEEAWMAITSSPFLSLIPLHATLNGCIEALTARTVSAAEVERVDGPTPSPPTSMRTGDRQ